MSSILSTTARIIDHPGAYLEQLLDMRGMSQAELAKRTGITPKTINSIIKGSAPVSPETAITLELVFREPTAKEWLKREFTYQLEKSKILKDLDLENELEVLGQININEMVKEKWIQLKENKVEQLRELYSFFGVSSISQLSPVWSQLEVNYRTSTVYKQNHFNIMAWLRKGELLAEDIKCEPYSAVLFKEALQECRKLSSQPFDKIYKKIQNMCSKAGVAVVFLKELPKVATSGAAHWIEKDKALIQLSLRGKRDDRFWFNFYHEAGHILLHGRKEQFIDNDGKGASQINDDVSDENDSPYFTEENKLKEAEADEFAASFLIPKKIFSNFVEVGDFSEQSIKEFAKNEEIAPGIVVGQLQKNGYIGWHQKNNLKERYDFPEGEA